MRACEQTYTWHFDRCSLPWIALPTSRITRRNYCENTGLRSRTSPHQRPDRSGNRRCGLHARFKGLLEEGRSRRPGRTAQGGINMKCTFSSMCRLLMPAAVLACSLSTSAVAVGHDIIVLSNRADLVSGGGALVRINLPPFVD